MFDSKQWMTTTWSEARTDNGLCFISIKENNNEQPLWVLCGALMSDYAHSNAIERDIIVDKLVAILDGGDWLSKSKALISLTTCAPSNGSFLNWMGQAQSNGIPDNPRFPNCAVLNQKQKLFVFNAINNALHYLEHGKYRDENNIVQAKQRDLLMQELLSRKASPSHELDKWFNLSDNKQTNLLHTQSSAIPPTLPTPKLKRKGL